MKTFVKTEPLTWILLGLDSREEIGNKRILQFLKLVSSINFLHAIFRHGRRYLGVNHVHAQRWRWYRNDWRKDLCNKWPRSALLLSC